MAVHTTLKRYFLILEKLKGDKKPSFKSIQSYLDSFDLSISHRTLQRDIEQMRNEFGIEIIYNRDQDFYFIDEKSSFSLKAFMAFVEMAMSSDLIRESLKDQKLLLKHLQFEPIDYLRGHENLKTIIESISSKRWIEFSYGSFANNTIKNYKVIPALLKRYQSRWYLIAQAKNGNHITFGIDRISELKATTNKFKDSDLTYPDKLDSVVGLNYSGGDIQKIVIQADRLQAKYLDALPLHPSQILLNETKEYSFFQYQLIPNLELIQSILRLGEQVKVIEPPSLVKDVKESLKNTLAQYKI